MRILNPAQVDALEKDRPELAAAIRNRAFASDNFIIPTPLEKELEETHGPLPKLNMPPLAQQAGTAAIALGRITQAVASGKKVFRTIEQQNDIWAICKTCEFMELAKLRCSKCGCRTGAKIAVATEHCPINKW